ncbi:LacI family DNA-binding transcriptional regulator [Anoxybacillus suryakundensis]|uniref:Transcriptional regulator, LacI family n=1 Tax=Anoxybacillus suryakundensis TaxID=1325335 RepID=A0A0K6GKQ5_9BACL|nr:LacI family DNA-binding transcriptional regulator [Anoxybacillus suryakundensis]CUA79138.1 transcriptional regulator, LacI family [Anoxybacillus suryakundensis]
MRKVTMADVARLANVSKSTVSQYLNKRYEYMSEETKKRIAEAIEQLQYRPNVIARSLKQKSTATIGVIVFNILHMLTTQVLRAIEDMCQQHDFHVIVCNTDDDPEKERKYIDMLWAKQVDGFIIFPTGKNVDLYKKMIEARLPLVFVDRTVEGIDVDAVLLDNEGAVQLAVRYLVKQGYKHIGLVAPPFASHVIPRTERIHAFRHVLRAANLPIEEEWIVTEQVKRIPERLDALLRQNKLPEAIFAINDLTLMEVLTFVKKHQLSIPTDVALISIDDVPFASVYTPSLTTIAQPAFDMGKKAAERLFMQMDGETRPQMFRLAPKLIERDSAKKRGEKNEW